MLYKYLKTVHFSIILVVLKSNIQIGIESSSYVQFPRGILWREEGHLSLMEERLPNFFHIFLYLHFYITLSSYKTHNPTNFPLFDILLANKLSFQTYVRMNSMAQVPHLLSPRTSHLGRYSVSSGSNPPISTHDRGNNGNRANRRRDNHGRRRRRVRQETQANSENHGDFGNRRNRRRLVRCEIREQSGPESLVRPRPCFGDRNELDRSIYPDHWSPGRSPRQYRISRGAEGYVSQIGKIPT